MKDLRPEIDRIILDLRDRNYGLAEEKLFRFLDDLDKLQKKAETTIDSMLRESGASFHAKQGATVVLEPLGAVRALVGGRDYGASQFNRAIDAQRQPGSSFKPYVYLTALMTGKFKPTTIVSDSPTCIGNYCVRNYTGSYAGSLPLGMALAKSLNTVAIKLSIAIGNGDSRVGRAKIIDTCRRLGITTPLEDTPSLPVGQSDVILLEHSAAYGSFVNGGKKVIPYAAVEIRNRQGDVLYRHDRDAPDRRCVAGLHDFRSIALTGFRPSWPAAPCAFPGLVQSVRGRLTTAVLPQ